MTPLLWSLIAIQVAMGMFDTFYHHELTERLAWRPSQRHELELHSVRNLFYTLLFLVLGWLAVYGIFAITLIAVLGAAIFGLRHFAAPRRLARMTAVPARGLVEKLSGRQTVLVTGATGFVGSRLVAALTSAGREV